MSELKIDIAVTLGEFNLQFRDELRLEGITALFGASGSGKTTLLRCIAGLEGSTDGSIEYAGEVWQAPGRFVPTERRGVGYVFQDARLFSHLSVEGNLRFADKRSRAATQAESRSAIGFSEVVDALDLEPLLSRRVAALSGGERQRVAIGRTLLARPRLLLMDEPLAALDLKRKAGILPYIERLPGAFNIPILYVTHALEEVARLARSMVVLDGGTKQSAGPVEEVFERLDLHEVTGRFEAGVLLTARVVAHDAHFQLTTLDHHGQIITMPLAPTEVGEQLRLRVRARDVALATTRPEGISVRNIVEGVVEQIVEEPRAAFAEALVDIGGARLRARITRAAVADLRLREGTPVFALIKSIAFDRRALPRRSD